MINYIKQNIFLILRASKNFSLKYNHYGKTTINMTTLNEEENEIS